MFISILLALFLKFNNSGTSCKEVFDMKLQRNYYTQADSLPRALSNDDGAWLFRKTSICRIQEKDYRGKTGFVVRFIVEVNGQLKFVGTDKVISKKIEDDVRQTLIAMPKWKPAKCGRQAVPYLYSIGLRYYKE